MLLDENFEIDFLKDKINIVRFGSFVAEEAKFCRTFKESVFSIDDVAEQLVDFAFLGNL